MSSSSSFHSNSPDSISDSICWRPPTIWYGVGLADDALAGQHAGVRYRSCDVLAVHALVNVERGGEVAGQRSASRACGRVWHLGVHGDRFTARSRVRGRVYQLKAVKVYSHSDGGCRLPSSPPRGANCSIYQKSPAGCVGPAGDVLGGVVRCVWAISGFVPDRRRSRPGAAPRNRPLPPGRARF